MCISQHEYRMKEIYIQKSKVFMSYQMSKNTISMCKTSHTIVLLILCCRSMKAKNLFSLFCTHNTCWLQTQSLCWNGIQWVWMFVILPQLFPCRRMSLIASDSAAPYGKGSCTKIYNSQTQVLPPKTSGYWICSYQYLNSEEWKMGKNSPVLSEFSQHISSPSGITIPYTFSMGNAAAAFK